jgi:hypothetical protein
VPSGIEFPPVENGLDYLKSAAAHLRGEPTPRDLKYAVLHPHASVEVLLKVRLMREHWALVFTNPGKATLAAFNTGSFSSIGLEDTISRLKDIANVKVTEAARESFKQLTNVRNKLQHFGLVEQAPGVELLAGQVLDAMLIFIGEELEPGASADDQESLLQARELIRKEISRIRALVDARMQRISDELDRQAESIVACPDCLQVTLELGEEGEPGRCLFCEREWSNPEELAGDYSWTVLHRSWYEATTSGEQPPTRTCPACEYEALVDNVLVRAPGSSPNSACFNCRLIASPGDIGECLRCGAPILTDEDSGTVCGDCWNDAMEKD